MWAREPAGEVLGGDVGSQEGEAERKAASSRALSWLPFDEIQGPEGRPGGSGVQQGSGRQPAPGSAVGIKRSQV